MRIEQLTFTRFIAAMAIVFFHFGKPLNIFSGKIVHTLLIQANIGVSYFFILSGFVMIIAYGRKSKVHPFSYLKNRFARIYPVYLLAIVLSLVYKIFLISEDVPFVDVFLNIFGLQSWIPEKVMTVNFPGWSLSVEFLFYAVFPLVFNYLYQKLNLKKLTFLIVTFWLISQSYFHFGAVGLNENMADKSLYNFYYYFPLLHLNQFLVGNLAGLFFIKFFKDKQGSYDFIIIALLILISLALIFRPELLIYHNGLLAVLFVPLIIFTALNTGFISQLSNKRIPIFLGEISYGVYILQIPVYWFTVYLLNKFGISGDLKIFIFTIIALLIFSALSYQYIEAPLRERIKKSRINFK